MASVQPHGRVFTQLIAEYGYELRMRSGQDSAHFSEVVAKPHRFGDTTLDMVSFLSVKDRADVERSATLIGWGENRRFNLSELLRALHCEPLGTDEDFITAARRLDRATVERLAPA